MARKFVVEVLAQRGVHVVSAFWPALLVLVACSGSPHPGKRGSGGDDTTADTAQDTGEADTDTDTDTDTDADTDTDTGIDDTGVYEGPDEDGDGYGNKVDCDDADAAINPGALEECRGGVDEDCDGEIDERPCADVLDLETASARLVSNAPYDYLLSVAGDFDADGDGVPDVVIGAPGDYQAGYRAGAAWVAFGPLSGQLTLQEGMTDGRVLRLSGFDEEFQAGMDVTGLVDSQGEGYGGVAIGSAPGHNDGSVFVFHGPLTAGEVSLENADGVLEDYVTYADTIGTNISSGDIDGDGVSDLVSDDLLQKDDDGKWVGAAYVVYGPVEGHTYDADIADVMWGEEKTSFGGEIAANGDTNGDGLSEVLVSATNLDVLVDGGGAVYLWHGPVLGSNAAADADARIDGHALVALTYEMDNGGDLNGDGLDDIAMMSKYWPEGDWKGWAPGAVWVMLGPVEGEVSLAEAQVEIDGVAGFDNFGWSVVLPGDLDGDGAGDLAVGAPFQAGSPSDTDSGRSWGPAFGAVYVFYGPLTGTLSANDADMVFRGGQAGDEAGYDLGAAGDTDGDGAAELLVDVIGDDSGEVQAGAIYLLGSSAFFGEATR